MSVLTGAILLTTLLTTGGATGALASTPAADVSHAAATSSAAIWHLSGYYETAQQCQVAKALRKAGGHPVDPVSGCYRHDLGYYFFWWSYYT